MDKFSYAIGLGIGQNLWSMGARSIDVCIGRKQNGYHAQRSP